MMSMDIHFIPKFIPKIVSSLVSIQKDTIKHDFQSILMVTTIVLVLVASHSQNYEYSSRVPLLNQRSNTFPLFSYRKNSAIQNLKYQNSQWQNEREQIKSEIEAALLKQDDHLYLMSLMSQKNIVISF